MAEMIPYGIVASMITRLASSTFQEVVQIYGIKSEIEKLKDTVEFIRAILLDAEKKQEQNHVKIWIRRLKQVLHDADDLFDVLVAEEMIHKVNGQGNIVTKVRSFFSSSNQVVFRLKMSQKIKKIQHQLVAIREDVSNLNLSQRVVIISPGETNRRETCSSVIESNIIGRDENKSEIINYLLHTQTDENLSLIALVGIGGLGKTALAQLVYNDLEVKRFFHKKIWVCVSEDIEVKALVKKILESLTTNRVHDLSLEVLKNKLVHHIRDQRYLLVLDDVWSEHPDKWNQLQTLLVYGALGSKVLVTTRSQKVAKVMNASILYVLNGLKKDQSWTLLRNVAFGKDKIESQNLLFIAEKIAEKCRGVPLAIKSIGGVLQSKRKESEWLQILDGEFWKLCEDDDSIMPVLKLSYDYLPVELRQCFVYCSLFPKDYRIHKEDLIQLWIAEGYLECSNKILDMEDLGDEYVHILLMRSFFQDFELNVNGDIEYFQMHDLMHDLALSIASADCHLHHEGKTFAAKPVHISFESKGIPSLDTLDVKKTRTILWPGMNNYKWGKGRSIENVSGILNLKRLRVLDLSGSSIIELPKSISKLKHLRYLDLSFCDQLTTLPPTINTLVNLQTLKLYHCVRLEFSIKAITNLINLRHLMIGLCKAFRDMMPEGLWRLTSMQYLSSFRVGQDDGKRKSAKLNELKDLNNLRCKLCIENLDRVKDVEQEAKDVNLEGKKYLWSLELYWDSSKVKEGGDSAKLLEKLHPPLNLTELKLYYYPGVRISSWLSSLAKLVHISFYGCLNCEYLPPLERFQFLKYLRIDSLNALHYIEYEEVSIISTVFFPTLKELVINKCPNLKGWCMRKEFTNETNVIENPSLPPFLCLSHLTIQQCENLTRMPTFPHIIERLELKSCNVNPLLETIHWVQASSSFTPLSIKYMEINDIFVEALPKEWMQNLTSLVNLQIVGIPSLPPMQHLPHASALRELIIRNVDNLDFQFIHHHLSALQSMQIHCCHNLKALPEWICNVASLHVLHIEVCPSLHSLPEGMPCLTNLYSLKIIGCPLLAERCKREIGSEWSKIVHIPHIIVNDSII